MLAGNGKQGKRSKAANIAYLQGIVAAQERILAVEKRQKEVEEEMEFYASGKSKGKGKEKEMPANLTSELKRTQAEKGALVATIVAYEKEMEQVRAKYEADKKRWADLKNPASAKAADAPPAPAPAPDKAVKKN